MAPSFVRIATGHAFGEAAALVGAFPPLTALVADIASFTEPLGNGAGFVDMGDEQFASALACLLDMGGVLRRASRSLPVVRF